MNRELAPPYAGEAPHALWLVSEDASIGVFYPREVEPWPDAGALVWAIDTRHLPLFWFPRECPRATFWADGGTTDEDAKRFLDGDRMRRVHAIESAWLDRMRSAHVVAYRLPEETFEPFDVGGYWVSRGSVEPLELVELGDLLRLHADARIELRVVPSLWPLWDRVVASTLEFSGIRLHNAAPRL